MKWTRSDRLLLVQWAFVTALGVALLRLTLFAVLPLLFTGTLLITLLATGQWSIAFRDQFKRSWLWIPASALGWLGAFYTLPIIAETFQKPPLITLFGQAQAVAVSNGLAVGFWLGLAQWVVLRLAVKHAGWWIVINVLAFIISFYVSDFVEQIGLQSGDYFFYETLRYGVILFVGIAVGLVTGFTLIRLRIRPVMKPDSV